MKKSKSAENLFNSQKRALARHETKLTMLYNWIEEQGIDTFDERFGDNIAVSIERGEFSCFDEFFEALEAFKRGEDVGYG